MADPPDYEQLAKRYLDLWQDQLAAAANDPKLARETARFADLFRQAAFGWPGGQASESSSAEGGRSAHDRSSGAESGAAPVGAAPANGAGDLADIARRLAELEARVAALESSAKSPRKPRGKRQG